MRVTMEILVASIDYGKRLPSNLKTLLFAFRMRRGTEFPPIEVQRLPNGRYLLLNGRYRLSAHYMLGVSKIKASFGIQEDPSPFKQLVCRPTPKHVVPQADGYSLPEHTHHPDL